MTQYCRYCCFLCVGDVPYCTEKEQTARFDVRAMDCNFPMTLDEVVNDISICGLDYEVIGNKFDNPELLEV